MNSTQKLQFAYILPNLFTATSAFLGIISVLASVQGDYDKAVIYIMLSLVFDGLDGRVARLTKTTSKFGAEFDSLADIVAFGVAPAILFYYSVGHNYGKLGSLVTAMYVVFGAIRLARFNVTSATSEPSVFIGVPIPTAAVVVAMWIMVYDKYPIFKGFELLMVVCMVFLSFLMVSNVRYPSFKKIDLEKSNVIKILIFLVICFSMTYLYPTETVALAITSYLIYGLARAIYTLVLAKTKKNKYSQKTEY